MPLLPLLGSEALWKGSVTAKGGGRSSDRGRMLGGTNPWLVILTLAFLLFILAVFMAKKDSAVRAIMYTFVLSIVGMYLLFVHLVPEIT